MTLAQLRYFCLACEEKSITKAASLLFVSQPAISSAIRELEKEYNLQLLERKYKGFALTENGRIFYEKAARLLRETELFSIEIHGLAEKDRAVTLGLTRSTGSSVYAQFFPHFVQESQQTEIHTVPGSSADLIQLLKTGRLDTAIMPAEAFSPVDNLESQVIQQTSMVFAIPENHPLAKEPYVTVPMLCNEAMVGTLNDQLKTRRLTEIFSKYGKAPQIMARYDQLTMVIHAVQTGIAIAFLPAELVQRYKGMVPVPLQGLDPIQVSLVWTKSSYEKPVVRKFVKSIIQFFSEIS